ICDCWMFQSHRFTGPARTKIRLPDLIDIEPTDQIGGDEDATQTREEQDGTPESSLACRMDCRAQAVSEQREGVLAAARRAEPAAARAALGKGGEKVCVRRTEGRGVTRRPLRRAEPTDRVPLHVWSGLEGGLPELLVHF